MSFDLVQFDKIKNDQFLFEEKASIQFHFISVYICYMNLKFLSPIFAKLHLN